VERFTALTALVPSALTGAYGTLLAVRFILGLGAAVIFPAKWIASKWIRCRNRQATKLTSGDAAPEGMQHGTNCSP
jgi:hypothetical protein